MHHVAFVLYFMGYTVKTAFKYSGSWHLRRRQASNIAFNGTDGEDSLQLLQFTGLIVKTVFNYCSSQVWLWRQSSAIAVHRFDCEDSLQLLQFTGLIVRAVFNYCSSQVWLWKQSSNVAVHRFDCENSLQMLQFTSLPVPFLLSYQKNHGKTALDIKPVCLDLHCGICSKRFCALKVCIELYSRCVVTWKRLCVMSEFNQSRDMSVNFSTTPQIALQSVFCGSRVVIYGRTDIRGVSLCCSFRALRFILVFFF
jgi:hypothetical protein